MISPAIQKRVEQATSDHIDMLRHMSPEARQLAIGGTAFGSFAMVLAVLDSVTERLDALVVRISELETHVGELNGAKKSTKQK